MANYITVSTLNREKLLETVLDVLSIYDLRQPIPAWIESLERYTAEKGVGYMTALKRARAQTKKPEWFKAYERWFLDLKARGIEKTILRTENVSREEMAEIADEDEASGI